MSPSHSPHLLYDAERLAHQDDRQWALPVLAWWPLCRGRPQGSVISKGNREKDTLKAQQHKKVCSGQCSALPVVFWWKQNNNYRKQQSLLFFWRFSFPHRCLRGILARLALAPCSRSRHTTRGLLIKTITTGSEKGKSFGPGLEIKEKISLSFKITISSFLGILLSSPI